MKGDHCFSRASSSGDGMEARKIAERKKSRKEELGIKKCGAVAGIDFARHVTRHCRKATSRSFTRSLVTCLDPSEQPENQDDDENGSEHDVLLASPPSPEAEIRAVRGSSKKIK